MASKFENTQVEINGTEYVIQKLPNREAVRLRKQWGSKESASGVDDEKMMDLCLEHFVVSPKKKIEDFDSIPEIEELVKVCIEFQYVGK